MKEILAIIRMNKMNDTKRALTEIGVNSFTARKVIGRGQSKVEYNVYDDGEKVFVNSVNQMEAGPKLIPKRLLNVVVSDQQVQDVVQCIIDTNKTGHAGDGKIFVMPVMDSIRIRTGEIGEAAIDENAVI